LPALLLALANRKNGDGEMQMKRLRWIGAAMLALQIAAPVVAQAPAPADPLARFGRQAPAGAPNIVIVLLDDVGFGATSSFGGPVPTPALDALARTGLRYNRFHTTAICSPTRASLLTGRNPHATGMGAVMNSVDDRPGYSGFHTKDTASIGVVLRENGYSTAAFGKWHQTPDWEVSPIGPFDRWPTGEGFDTFYGFQGGETDQFDPSLFDGTTPVMRPAGAHYHLTEDLAARATAWLRTQHELTPDKPALLYFSTGGAHAPLQAPRDWIDKFRGKFDSGWDAMRVETLKRQKAMGIVPKDTALTPRDAQLPAWDVLTPDQKRVSARQMEVYAAFLAHTDAQVGKLIDTLKANGEFDNTLFFYIVGDNGGSGEGGLSGSGSYMGAIQGMPETDAIRLAGIDAMGGPGTYPHYAAGWAWALNAPMQWMKTVASHLGATRNGMVVSWPKGISAPAGIRSQFSHVNDIVPTILEAAQIPAPDSVDGIKQKPINGTSLVYSFNDAKAPERHTTQYFEVFGHRAIYHDGWMASAFHTRLPWKAFSLEQKSFDADKWELYHLTRDFSQSRDLAARQPARLAEMKTLFMAEAAANNVLPLTNVIVSTGRGLPSIPGKRKVMRFGPGTTGIPESALPKTYNRSFGVTATLDTGADAKGVVAALGGSSAGWSLWLDTGGVPVLSYRLFNIQTVTLRGAAPLSPGAHQLRFDFDYDGKGFGKGGTLRFSIDGAAAGSEHIPASPPGLYTIDESFDVGRDRGSPVADYPAAGGLGFGFGGGTIGEVVIELR
jgi:arylsulfatase